MTDLLIRLLALGRIGLGVALLTKPEDIAGGWVGDVVERPGGQVLARGLGMRDVVIGLGSLAASSRGSHGETARWLAAGVLADVADTADTLATADDRPEDATRMSAGLAAGAGLLGAALLLVVRRRD